MNNTAIVSIIIPVYNAGPYLDKCISSVLQQTYTQLQIILVDDGSTDESLEICNRYSQSDNRIIVVHKENGGVSSARNLGLSLSTGCYILFIDSDDWVEPCMVQQLIKIQNTEDYDLILFGHYLEDLMKKKTYVNYIDTNIQPIDYKLADILPELIENEKLNALWNKLYKSSVIIKNNLCFDPTLSIGEDALFNYTYSFHVNKLITIDKCFYHYTKRKGDSLSNRYNSKKYDMKMRANNQLKQLVFRYQAGNVRLISSCNVIRMKNIYSCLLDLFHKDCPLQLCQKYKYVKKLIGREDYKTEQLMGQTKYRLLQIVLYTHNATFILTCSYLIFIIRKLTNVIKKYI